MRMLRKNMLELEDFPEGGLTETFTIRQERLNEEAKTLAKTLAMMRGHEAVAETRITKFNWGFEVDPQDSYLSHIKLDCIFKSCSF